MNKSKQKLHPLQCPDCHNFYLIKFEDTKFTNGDVSFVMNIPVVHCENCNNLGTIIPKHQLDEFAEAVFQTLDSEDDYYIELETAFSQLDSKHKFEEYNHLGFKYDPRDIYIIPGIAREFNQGYLNPVFFDKDVLLYYNNHPDYSVKLNSFSSGNIYHKQEALLSWGFGINRSGKIFIWLGDLSEDFSKEDMESHLKRFQASNIESDHDVVSKFYFSQNPFSFADCFQHSDNERQIFELKNEFDNKFLDKFKLPFSKIEIHKLIDFYKHPILEEQHQIFEAYLSLNKFLIETIQTSNLKEILQKSGINQNVLKPNGQSLGSLKLFELFISEVLSLENGSDLISPLFVLNDLRQLHGHISDGNFINKYNSCKMRLSITEKITDYDFFTVVISEIIKFYEYLNTKI